MCRHCELFCIMQLQRCCEKEHVGVNLRLTGSKTLRGYLLATYLMVGNDAGPESVQRFQRSRSSASTLIWQPQESTHKSQGFTSGIQRLKQTIRSAIQMQAETRDSFSAKALKLQHSLTVWKLWITHTKPKRQDRRMNTVCPSLA